MQLSQMVMIAVLAVFMGVFALHIVPKKLAAFNVRYLKNKTDRLHTRIYWKEKEKKYYRQTQISAAMGIIAGFLIMM